MIRSTTAFVIGAGAGVPFDFPTAQGLLQDGYKALGDATARSLLGKAIGKPAAFLGEFQLALRDTGCSSIDQFVEVCPEFLQAGKALIAYCLLPRENHDKLSDLSLKEHWLQLIWERMRTPEPESFKQNTVTFVTFNYDRVIEHYFMKALETIYRTPNVAHLLKPTRIVHIYGSLGPLPGYDPGSPEGAEPLPFGAPPTVENVQIAMKSITLQPERNAPDLRSFDDARVLLKRKRYVFFLGMSYGKVNIERIGDAAYWKDRTSNIAGMGYGMEDGEVSAAKKLFGGQLDFIDDGDANTLSCRKFLRRHYVNWEEVT